MHQGMGRVSERRLWLGTIVTLAIPLTAGFLAGGRNAYAQTILFGLLAAALALNGRTSRLPTGLGYVIAALILLGLTSFLPRSLFTLPGWRITMEHDLGVPIMQTLSPQPWVTLEEWTLLAASAVWLTFCAGATFQENHRRFLMQGLVCGIAVMAILTLMMRWFAADSFIRRFYEEWRGGEEASSLFPNRNHFASLCASGVLLSAVCFRDAWARRSWFASTLFAVSATPLFAAVIATRSRGGLLILCIGFLTWVTILVFRRLTFRRVGIALAAILVLTTAIMLTGRNVLEHFSHSMAGTNLFNSDARFPVFQDTVRMMLNHPLMGIGLGNFENVFPRYQTYTNNVARFIHPESDWLWLGSEMGIPALVLALAAVGIIMNSSLRYRIRNESRTSRHLRIGALIASCMTLIHGMVDTPLHLTASGLTAFLLLGISIHRDNQPSELGIVRHLRYAACAGLCLLSVNSWATGMGRPLWPSASAAQDMHRRAWTMIADNQAANALALTQTAILWEPMSWEGYYLRASARLMRGEPSATALQDFAIARYLEPNSGPICWKEAELWLKYDPPYAISAWREAMSRETAEATNYYYAILSGLPKYPDLRSSVRTLAKTPSLKVLYLCIAANESDAQGVMDDVLSNDPELTLLTEYDKRRFFICWARWGNREVLFEKLSNHPAWRKAGWMVLGDSLASKNNFKAAYDLALEYAVPPPRRENVATDDVDSLRRALLFNPSDLKIGLDLFEAQKKTGLKRDAITTLEQLVKNPEAKRRCLYELALLHADAGNYTEAWRELRTYSDS